MATTAQHIAADLAAQMLSDGEVVVYKTVSIRALFVLSAIDPQLTGAGSRQVGELHVLAADVASPAIDDSVTIGGETWKVKGKLPGSFWAKHILRVESDRRVRP